MATKTVRTEHLTKRYGDVDALKDLNLEIAQGEVVGYLGPNGAGKTTTVRLLLGLARPTAGRAEIFGLDCQRQPVEVHRRLAYVPGEANLWPSLTGAETLHLLGRVHGRRRHGLPRRAHRALRPRHLQEGARLLQGEPTEGPAHRRFDVPRFPQQTARPGRQPA